MTRSAENLGQKDPGMIVIDEIAGFLVAHFLAPFGVALCFVAFPLFCYFDVAKVFPASGLEKLPKGSGIVFDDFMAGIYTLFVLQVFFGEI